MILRRADWTKASLCPVVGLLLILVPLPLLSQAIVVKGRVTDPKGNALPQASVEVVDRDHVLAQATSGPGGLFQLALAGSGDFVIKAEAPGFRPVSRSITVRAGANSDIEISMRELSSRSESVTVTADVNEVDVLSPIRRRRFCVGGPAGCQPGTSGRADFDSRLSD